MWMQAVLGDGPRIYVPDIETDTLMLEWWVKIRDSGELGDVFTEVANTPSGFLTLLQRLTLFYHIDEKGIAIVAFFEPFMAGASFGLWVRPDWRREYRKQTWDKLEEIMQVVFQHVPVVIFMTKREHTAQTAVDFGFKVAGNIPHLYGGQDATVGYMDSQTFEEHHGRIT